MLLLHGFPEIAYSWRHQMGPLGEAGFHVVAPDLPGYGRSDKPDVTYDCEWVNATLIGLADAFGSERLVIAGHDWGGLLVWIMARQYPERIAGVIGVNTPDLPRPSGPPVQILRGARSIGRSTSCSSRTTVSPSGCSRGVAAPTTTSST